MIQLLKILIKLLIGFPILVICGILKSILVLLLWDESYYFIVGIDYFEYLFDYKYRNKINYYKGESK